ncbi:hypothetical protein A2V80_01685 [Candidatus Woesebacteria bacterium RBG_16_39_8b]|uniref:HIT domain-containing protein n=1 Tax=Candidatus Woesebacteria bacterium RBG_16_39_8b TaxID=1802482 RepID=A0A1F7XC86_9BACT|nr:MAG: hypothetical protein A2V80_01685 [Candidatus Woesebacteria bacterium RBG_16_39_8b]
MLRVLLKEFYQNEHGRKRQVAKLSRRFEYGSNGSTFELFLSGMDRQSYQKKIKEYKYEGRTDCRLCWSDSSIVYRRSLCITADIAPFFPYHMLLRPMKLTARSKSLTGIGNNIFVGKTEKIDLVCRNYFTKDDIKTMANLAQDSDYIVTQAMRGSGASIPEHIHGHAFPKTETEFPLLNKRYFKLFWRQGNSSIYIIEEPTFAILVKGKSDLISDIFTKIRNEFGYPSNHIIKVDEDFGGLVGVYIPRVKETPGANIFHGWKFGVFEVLGLFDVETKERYLQLNYNSLFKAVREVTLHNSKTQAEILKYIEKI